MDQNIEPIILINESRTAWPGYIFKLFLNSLDNLRKHVFIFQKGVDNFEIERKTCPFLIRGAVPP